MRIAIHVRSGPMAGRRIVMRAGQVARFGRTEWADFAFPDDSTMAEMHFEIMADASACQLQSLSPKHPTTVNGEPVTQRRLKDGDLVSAGQTSFAVEVQGDNQSPPLTGALAAPETVAPIPPDRTAKLAAYFQLSEPALELAQACQDTEVFEQRLIDADLLEDAVRWRAHRLPKPVAVAWAVACMDCEPTLPPLSPVEQAARQTAIQWSEEPCEKVRQQALRELDTTEGNGIVGALVAAAAWSEGSLVPADAPPVPPDDRLTGRLATSAIIMASQLAQPPGQSATRLAKYLSEVPLARVQPRSFDTLL